MITPRQLEALAAIARLGSTPPPSLRELGAELLVSHAAARLLVAALERHDPPMVEVARGRRRSIRLTSHARDVLVQAAVPAPELPDGDHREWRNRYVFGHARDAIRVWAAHRDGIRVDRARSGRGGGRTPSIEDVSRVGRVLATYSGPQLDVLVRWARGAASTTDNRVEALVERVSLRLQQLRLVSRAASVQARAHRTKWRSADGQERETAALLPGRDDSACNLAGNRPRDP